MRTHTLALVAVAVVALLLVPLAEGRQLLQDDAGDGDDLTGGIVIFPPADVPRELEGMPPVPKAASDAMDAMVPGSGGFFSHLFDTPDCPPEGCPPPSPAPPPVWLQPIAPPPDHDAPPLPGALGNLVGDVTNTTKTDNDGSDLDGALGFRVYSVGPEVKVDANAAGHGGHAQALVVVMGAAAVLVVLTAVAMRARGPVRQGREATGLPTAGAATNYGSIDPPTPRVEYARVSATDAELPL